MQLVLIGILIVILLVVFSLLKSLGWGIVPIVAWLIIKYYGWFIFFSLCTVILYLSGFVHLIKMRLKKNRINKLMNKYHDEDIVDGIIRHTFWIGQTASQLLDSIGNPVDISKWRNSKDCGETWKYDQTGKNRYDLKIHLVNDEVSGWDKK